MKWETQKKDRLPCSCCRVSGLIDCESFLSSSFLLDQIYIKRRTKAMSPHPISTPFLRRLPPSRRQQRRKSKCEGKKRWLRFLGPCRFTFPIRFSAKIGLSIAEKALALQRTNLCRSPLRRLWKPPFSP
jgi:hypothetical protein